MSKSTNVRSPSPFVIRYLNSFHNLSLFTVQLLISSLPVNLHNPPQHDKSYPISGVTLVLKTLFRILYFPQLVGHRPPSGKIRLFLVFKFPNFHPLHRRTLFFPRLLKSVHWSFRKVFHRVPYLVDQLVSPPTE